MTLQDTLLKLQKEKSITDWKIIYFIYLYPGYHEDSVEVNSVLSGAASYINGKLTPFPYNDDIAPLNEEIVYYEVAPLERNYDFHGVFVKAGEPCLTVYATAMLKWSDEANGYIDMDKDGALTKKWKASHASGNEKGNVG